MKGPQALWQAGPTALSFPFLAMPVKTQGDSSAATYFALHIKHITNSPLCSKFEHCFGFLFDSQP